MDHLLQEVVSCRAPCRLSRGSARSERSPGTENGTGNAKEVGERRPAQVQVQEFSARSLFFCAVGGTMLCFPLRHVHKRHTGCVRDPAAEPHAVFIKELERRARWSVERKRNEVAR